MISISKLLCDTAAPGDHLRYGTQDDNPSVHPQQAFQDKRPIVVWGCTRRCNLRCIHCYSDSHDEDYSGEMTTEEAKSFLQDLSDFSVPVILFSGGEPLLREDIFELAHFSKELGIRPVLSTNGTLIREGVIEKIGEVGFGEVGISIDGIGERNDRFRGSKGAFDAALQGIRNCVALGQRVSIRFTISRHNYTDLPAVFELIERENIDRACFYHLAYTGRAHNMVSDDLSHEETRAAVDLICDHTLDLHKRGLDKEILTVGNHADAVYLFLKISQEQPERAAEVLQLLRSNGGNNSGVRIGAVDNLGNVHPDQFWWHYSIDNVKRRKFGDIWLDTSAPLMLGLKDRRGLLKGRCSNCQYVDICGGNLRVRAEAVYGDVWAEDPACYLTDEEIGISGN